MNIVFEEQGGYGSGQAVRFSLQQGELIHVLHPQQIIVYRGNPEGRADSLMNIKGMYRKKKLIQARISGPSEFLAALPPSFSMKTIRLEGDSDLLYDARHLFFYSMGVTMKTRILSVKNMFITRDAVKMKFAGNGEIGILTQGIVCEAELHPVEPLFVDAGSVIAYPENAKLELCVYGNHLASQHMNYHWKMTGRGSVLIQAGRQNDKLERDMKDDGLVKRILREVIPFGGVVIK